MENMEASTGVVQKAMSQRTCGSCRWWQYHRDWSNKGVGQCRQNASGLPEVYNTDFCGQWADKTITPEQEEKRELVRRFAIALTSGAVFDESIKQTADAVWIVAQAMVDAEPGP
jgi:hypothetical protein